LVVPYWLFFVRGAQSVVEPEPEHRPLPIGAFVLQRRAQRGQHAGACVFRFRSRWPRSVYFEAAVVIISLTLFGQLGCSN
jgi:hypothetical protein